MTTENNDSIKKEAFQKEDEDLTSYADPPIEQQQQQQQQQQQPSVVFVQPQSAIQLGNKPQATKWYSKLLINKSFKL